MRTQLCERACSLLLTQLCRDLRRFRRCQLLFRGLEWGGLACARRRTIGRTLADGYEGRRGEAHVDDLRPERCALHSALRVDRCQPLVELQL